MPRLPTVPSFAVGSLDSFRANRQGFNTGHRTRDVAPQARVAPGHGFGTTPQQRSQEALLASIDTSTPNGSHGDSLPAFVLAELGNDPDALEFWIERAGVREFDAGLGRDAANRLALNDVLGVR